MLYAIMLYTLLCLPAIYTGTSTSYSGRRGYQGTREFRESRNPSLSMHIFKPTLYAAYVFKPLIWPCPRDPLGVPIEEWGLFGPIVFVILILRGAHCHVLSGPSVVVDASQIPHTLHGVWLRVVCRVCGLADDLHRAAQTLLHPRVIEFRLPEGPGPCPVQGLLTALPQISTLPGLASIRRHVYPHDAPAPPAVGIARHLQSLAEGQGGSLLG
mmetsp:Transcript_7111/g.15551  ORF Transcript_7111/g.15551 Transcript_7111/m.15551 type:complete len:213 (-) Transcript_7111:403-1041(-)